MSSSNNISSAESTFNLAFSEEEESYLNLDDSSVEELYNIETKVNRIGINSFDKKFTIKNISKAPIRCVIKDCDKIMSGREIFGHFLHKHRTHKNEFQVYDLVENEKCLIIIDYNTLALGENVCLGIIAYNCHTKSHEIQSSKSKMSLGNISLPHNYVDLTEHLPVFIIGCLTYSSVLISDEESARCMYEKCLERKKTEDEMLVIWLASATLQKPLYSTLKIKSQDTKTSLEMITSVRNFSNSYDVHALVNESSDTLNLSNGFLRTLSKDFRTHIELELSLFEDDI